MIEGVIGRRMMRGKGRDERERKQVENSYENHYP